MKSLKQLKKDKKGAGLVTGIVVGIAFLVVMTIVSFLIVDTLNGANLIAIDSDSAVETGTLDEGGQTLAVCDAAIDATLTSTSVTNSTGEITLTSGNYTTAGCILTITAAAVADLNGTAINVSYDYTFDGPEQAAVDKMIGNYSQGIDNVSAKIPTILLIVAVVLLFGAIVLLVARSRQMGGGGSEV